MRSWMRFVLRDGCTVKMRRSALRVRSAHAETTTTPTALHESNPNLGTQALSLDLSLRSGGKTCSMPQPAETARVLHECRCQTYSEDARQWSVSHKDIHG